MTKSEKKKKETRYKESKWIRPDESVCLKPVMAQWERQHCCTTYGLYLLDMQ